MIGVYLVNMNVVLKTYFSHKRGSDVSDGWHFHVLSIYENQMEVYVDNKIKSRKDNDLQIKPNETNKVELHGL